MPLQLDPLFLTEAIPAEYVAALGGFVLSGAAILGTTIRTLWNSKQADLAFQREENKAARGESLTAFLAVQSATEASREFVKTGGLLLVHLEDQDAKMARLITSVEKLMESQLASRKTGQDLVNGILADMKDMKNDHTVIRAGIDALRRTGSGS